MLAAAIAADNVVTNLHFLLIIFLPSIAWLARRYPTHHMDTAEQFTAESRANLNRIADLNIAGLLAALALAFMLAKRARIKKRTIAKRRLHYQRHAA